MSQTVIHLVRHGEVYNPGGVLYGRLPDFHLSDLGRQMALRATEALAGRDIVHLRCSPLERAQETMQPIAAAVGLPVTLDERVIEAGNLLQGRQVTAANLLRGGPATWWLFRNLALPSWGEHYTDIVARMQAMMRDVLALAAGHEAAVVSHQLPIWMTRCDAEGRRLMHDPRKRECALASITSFRYLDDRLVAVEYRVPAADLLRPNQRVTSTKFVAGA